MLQEKSQLEQESQLNLQKIKDANIRHKHFGRPSLRRKVPTVLKPENEPPKKERK